MAFRRYFIYLFIFAKRFILDVWHDAEYVSDKVLQTLTKKSFT